MKIGIIRETKFPPDTRVPLTPTQCREIVSDQGIEILIEPSSDRCYSDQDYADEGIPVTGDLSSCDILLGVKEPTLPSIRADTTYFVFSHTIKEQPYNRELLRTFLKKNVRLVDYEVLTDPSGQRLIAFGHFAGLVGAHNALWTWHQRQKVTGALPRLSDLKSFDEVIPFYNNIQWPPFSIVLTGDGRVASGAAKTLRHAGIRQLDPDDFLSNSYDEAIFTQIGVKDYVRHPDGRDYNLTEFFDDPTDYQMNFNPFYQKADVMINGIYWDPRSPAFFTIDEMKQTDFRIRVIADITCDIAPESSIPSTLRPSTIADPVYGFDPERNAIVEPFDQRYIDVMAIDNLPNEVPRDASRSFGEQFIEHILPELKLDDSDILHRATIAINGQLGDHFGYLKNYVEG